MKNIGMGSRIREIRKFLGFTQKQISQKTGLRQSDISRYETGEYSIPTDSLEALSKIGVNIQWFINNEGYPFRKIGQRLREAYHARHISSNELGLRIGVPKETIHAWEEERELIPMEMVEKIASVTQADLIWLRTGYDRDGTLTSSVFHPAEGAPPGAHPDDRVREEEPGPIHPSQIAGAVRQAFMIVDQVVQERGLLIGRDYQGMVVGSIAEYMLRGEPGEKTEALMEEMLRGLPKG